MRNYFAMEKEKRKNALTKQLRYCLPSATILHLVSFAGVELPNGELLVLKDRKNLEMNPNFPDNLKFDYICTNFGNTMVEAESLSRLFQGKNIEIKYSALTNRGKELIVDYLTEDYRSDLRAKLSRLSINENFILENKAELGMINNLFDGSKILEEIAEAKKDTTKVKVNEENVNSFLEQFNEIAKAVDLTIGALSESKKIAEKKDLLSFITPGSGKTSSLLSLFVDLDKGELEEMDKEKENTPQPSDDIFKEQLSSLNLYTEVRFLAVMDKNTGKISILKDREGKKMISPEDEFIVVQDPSQIPFYPEGFFAGKNVLIVS